MNVKTEKGRKVDTRADVVARQRKQIKDLTRELADLKEAYFELVDRMELIEDLHPQVLDTLREHGMLGDND